MWIIPYFKKNTNLEKQPYCSRKNPEKNIELSIYNVIFPNFFLVCILILRGYCSKDMMSG